MSEVASSEPALSFDWTEYDGPSAAVIETIHDHSGDDLRAMEPLYEVVDPDALDRLFAPTRHGGFRPNGEIQFEYHGYHVVVTASGDGYVYGQEGSLVTEAGAPTADTNVSS